MKIALVVSYYKPAYVYGGPVKSISAVCEALVRLGVEVTVLTTHANGAERLEVPLGKAVAVAGVEVFYYPLVSGLPRSFFYSPALARACFEKIKHYDLAVLECFFTHAMGPAVEACSRAEVPYVVPLRGQLLPWALQQKRAKKLLYLALFGRAWLNQATALHCTASVEAESLARLRLKTPLFVVPNGVDTRRFLNLPPRGSLRRRLGISTQSIVLLYLGRLHRKKRPDIAVEALALAQLACHKNVHLVMAGFDEEQQAQPLQAQAQRRGCAEYLHLLGLLPGEALLGALADADLLLMPSEPHSENFGMVALEAMAAGVPVLVSESVPVGYWVMAARAGRVVPCTVDSFAQATCELISNPKQLRGMGQRGCAIAQQRFDISVVARQMLSQYQAIVSTGYPLPAS